MCNKLFLAIALARILGLCVAAAGESTVPANNSNATDVGSGTLHFYDFADRFGPGGSAGFVGNGFFNFRPGNGATANSSSQSGDLLSNSISLGAGTYAFCFEVAGSQDFPTTTVLAAVIGVPTALQTYTQPSDQSFLELTIDFTLSECQTIKLEFLSLGGPSDVGDLLNNVTLSHIATAPAAVGPSAVAPVPSAAWSGFVLMGLMAAGKLHRKFRS